VGMMRPSNPTPKRCREAPRCGDHTHELFKTDPLRISFSGFSFSFSFRFSASVSGCFQSDKRWGGRVLQIQRRSLLTTGGVETQQRAF
jgi:hypothetical protein